MITKQKLLKCIEEITGKSPHPIEEYINLISDTYDGEFGCSQFNEVLLTLGHDRVTCDFFNWFTSLAVNNRNDYINCISRKFSSEDELEASSLKLRKICLQIFGSTRYGFKQLSKMDKYELDNETKTIFPKDISEFCNRSKSFELLERIDPDDAYYLGYIVDEKMKEMSKTNPKQSIDLKTKVNKAREKGERNHYRYLTLDHIDVYIATSMREPIEYHLVSGFSNAIKNNKFVKNLNLSIFDPTQGYCKNPIDKGLVEGLMLKRAKCTIYHAQEIDTLGKDSELASTLAQGKPVIAYVPELHDSKKMNINPFY